MTFQVFQYNTNNFETDPLIHKCDTNKYFHCKPEWTQEHVHEEAFHTTQISRTGTPQLDTLLFLLRRMPTPLLGIMSAYSINLSRGDRKLVELLWGMIKSVDKIFLLYMCEASLAT